MKYYKDDSKNLTFVGSPKATKITGRLLAQNLVEITPGEQSTAKQLYNFDEKNMTYYKDIVLKSKERRITAAI
ncbi:hypothetical protein [Pseudobacteroides cellulosolvens]|uniref:Uncharacterized protein n=1 Tax=Pseudobacteroides cellulosolvens ATCC 35603 = DSM 2933 TaxID=398512 RepID=A0A0L6JHL6_9FIRM|nr:hypothetical protein [Pseudobacteroides cellulosolvens]KNY25204.1 hypothetical protein Bccel_0461 [Pseudobacteroides cellulosolvens ATCC 35603 = DSM 2933]